MSIRATNAPNDGLTLYERCKRDGCIIDSHESDLYVLATPRARQLVADSGQVHETFYDSNHRLWFDVPFAFDPWWNARGRDGWRRGGSS